MRSQFFDYIHRTNHMIHSSHHHPPHTRPRRLPPRVRPARRVPPTLPRRAHHGPDRHRHRHCAPGHLQGADGSGSGLGLGLGLGYDAHAYARLAPPCLSPFFLSFFNNQPRRSTPSLPPRNTTPPTQTPQQTLQLSTTGPLEHRCAEFRSGFDRYVEMMAISDGLVFVWA